MKAFHEQPRSSASRARIAVAGIALAASIASVGCSSLAKRKEEATYAPTESVIEIVAVLRRHVPDDTYRFQPATDFSGRNVYRAALLRLESLEKLHATALRAGHLNPAIDFAKARALERLRAYDLAAQHFSSARAAEALREDAIEGARINAALAAANRVGLQLDDPMGRDSMLPLDSAFVVSLLDERIADLTQLLLTKPDVPYPAIIREEIERADVTRARYFTAIREVAPEGNVRAVSEWQRTISRHGPSKNRRTHMMETANLYAELAREYVIARPPESLNFDPPLFRELVDGATQLYEAVAHQDGTPEKIEAARRLEAFLAFTLQVDSERFTE